MVVDVYNLNKEKVGEIELNEAIFNGEIKEHLMKAYVQYQLTNKRSGNAHTKTRSEIAGSGKKPWKQKGTGRARAGTKKSPIWRGGGVVFGPRKREYTFKMNKKEKKKAIISSLNYKLNNSKLIVIDKFEISEIKTKNVVNFLKKFDINSATLIDNDNNNLKISSRNIPNIKYLESEGLNVFDVLKYEYLLIAKDSLAKIEERLLS
jgi:large subunit ribosomal protein L4